MLLMTTQPLTHGMYHWCTQQNLIESSMLQGPPHIGFIRMTPLLLLLQSTLQAGSSLTLTKSVSRMASVLLIFAAFYCNLITFISLQTVNKLEPAESISTVMVNHKLINSTT